MGYQFEDVKSLFDRYNIIKQNGEYAVVDRKTGIPYSDSQLVARVKFAHTWFLATEYGRSRMTIEKVITKQDYEYAFNEGAKASYDAIMACSQQIMLAAGTLFRPEVLKKEVEATVNYRYAGKIVDGIYQNERYANSFEDWVRYSTNNPIFYPQKGENESFGRR